MRLLVVGSGGREHALAWTFSRSNDVEKVFAYPGREGFEGDGAVRLAGNDLSPGAILEAARANRIDLTVITT